MKTEENDSGVSKSVLKNLPTGFREEADAMDAAELETAIVESEANIRESEQAMAADEKYQGAKGIAKDLAEPYKDLKKAQRAKIAYLLHCLDSKGQL